MKKHIIRIALIASILSVSVSCKKETAESNQPKQTEQISDATIYNLDKEQSNIDWRGYKIFKSQNTSHFGTMNFSEGEISVKNGAIVSGKFVADTKSLTNIDLADDKEASEKLNQHLKSVDFFDVEKYPTAVFELTKVTPTEQGDYNSTLEGNLTIKDQTKQVSFNANVKVTDEQITISTEPTDINRQDFNVNFLSPVENGILKNEITLQISVKANVKK